MTLTLTKTLPGSTRVPMPSLVLIGPAVRPAIGNRQTDKHIAFYYVDISNLGVEEYVNHSKYKIKSTNLHLPYLAHTQWRQREFKVGGTKYQSGWDVVRGTLPRIVSDLEMAYFGYL